MAGAGIMHLPSFALAVDSHMSLSLSLSHVFILKIEK